MNKVTPVLSTLRVIHDLEKALDADPRPRAEIATLAGVSLDCPRRWKRGRSAVHLGLLDAMAQVLGLEVRLIPKGAASPGPLEIEGVKNGHHSASRV